MSRSAKSARKLGLHLGDTSFEVKELAALIAMEVVVVFLSRKFVSVRISGNRHNLQPFLCYKSLNVAIHGGNSQPWMMEPGGLQSLVWREWPLILEKSLSDRRLLLCVAFLHRVAKNAFSVGF